jgi:uncharacterized protein (TIGR02569 family)
MTTEEHEDIAAIRDTLAQSYTLNGSFTLMAGGESRTYRAGDHIYRRETDITEAAFIAELYDAMQEHGFRIPKPLKSNDGPWVTPDGWSAWTFVAGQPATPDDIPQVVTAIQAFHQALASTAYPMYLADRDSPFDRADKAAWANTAFHEDERFTPVIMPLLQRKRPVEGLQPQLIHGDLNEENILVAPNIPPAIIDMTPYWRPAEFALAVFAYWVGPYRGDTSILSAFAHIREFDQMLIRAGLRMILITHEFAKLGATIGDIVGAYRPPVDLICQWVDG